MKLPTKDYLLLNSHYLFPVASAYTVEITLLHVRQVFERRSKLLNDAFIERGR